MTIRHTLSGFFSLLTLFGLCRVGEGQQCRPGTVYQGVQVQQQVQYQTYQSAYPTYQYQVQQQTINYPVVVGVPLSDLGINYYFSVSPEKRESRIVEQVTKELLSRMNSNGYGILVPIQPGDPNQPQPLEQNQVQQPPQPQQPSDQGHPTQPNGQQPVVVEQPETPIDQNHPPVTQQQQPPAKTAPSVTSPISGQGGLPPAVQSQLQVLSLMQAKCMKCHKPGEVKKGVKLFNSDGSLFDNDLEKRIDILNSVLRKEGFTAMPPNQSLMPDEKKVFVNWLQEKL